MTSESPMAPERDSPARTAPPPSKDADSAADANAGEETNKRPVDHVPGDDEPDDGASTASTPGDGGPDKPLPPLLKRILDEYSARGAPPAYLPKKKPPSGK